eukprot:TRINITY_DN4166_c1_g1_i1.p2 TRINITY_DN4166_c1_g1~~TRINITY_DN4166_c1_g1_i1.p2  ORF type:complete len:308 (+),score=96.62 TRINITY_DN4166_c1_g1_i1:392-1315(+)
MLIRLPCNVVKSLVALCLKKKSGPVKIQAASDQNSEQLLKEKIKVDVLLGSASDIYAPLMRQDKLAERHVDHTFELAGDYARSSSQQILKLAKQMLQQRVTPRKPTTSVASVAQATSSMEAQLKEAKEALASSYAKKLLEGRMAEFSPSNPSSAPRKNAPVAPTVPPVGDPLAHQAAAAGTPTEDLAQMKLLFGGGPGKMAEVPADITWQADMERQAAEQADAAVAASSDPSMTALLLNVTELLAAVAGSKPSAVGTDAMLDQSSSSSSGSSDPHRKRGAAARLALRKALREDPLPLYDCIWKGKLE